MQFSVVAELFPGLMFSSASVCPAKRSKNLEKKGKKENLQHLTGGK